jgi:hypothetical protein
MSSEEVSIAFFSTIAILVAFAQIEVALHNNRKYSFFINGIAIALAILLLSLANALGNVGREYRDLGNSMGGICLVFAFFAFFAWYYVDRERLLENPTEMEGILRKNTRDAFEVLSRPVSERREPYFRRMGPLI